MVLVGPRPRTAPIMQISTTDAQPTDLCRSRALRRAAASPTAARTRRRPMPRHRRRSQHAAARQRDGRTPLRARAQTACCSPNRTPSRPEAAATRPRGSSARALRSKCRWRRDVTAEAATCRRWCASPPRGRRTPRCRPTSPSARATAAPARARERGVCSREADRSMPSAGLLLQAGCVLRARRGGGAGDGERGR